MLNRIGSFSLLVCALLLAGIAAAQTVTITFPVNNSTVTSPVTVTASFTNGGTAQYMKLWVDGVAQYYNNGQNTLSHSVSLAAGSHHVVVQAYNGTTYSANATFVVQSTTTPITTTPTVTISSPAANSTVTSAVTVNATFSNGGTAQYMKLWVDGTAQYSNNGQNTLSYAFSLGPGSHQIIVQAYNGTLYSATSNFSVLGTAAPTITITSPAANSNVSSPTTVNATFSNGGTAQYMKLWVDGVAQYFNNNQDTLSYPVSLATGSHQIVVQAYNGTLYNATEYVSVGSSTGTTSPQPSTSGLQYYVSTTGSDSADGSSAHPWATIQHAATAVTSPGATVHVAPGTYAAVTTSTSGSSGAPIRFISDVQWGAKIRSSGVQQAWYNTANYVDIAGFDISGDGRLGILNMGSHVRIIGNNVHNISAPCTSNGGAGIDNANYSAGDDDVIGNIVHDIGSLSVQCYTVQGIYHSNLRGHILNNISYRNEGWGIQLWHAPMDVVISSNLVFQNGQGGIVVGAGDAPGGVTANGMIVTNNIVIHNTSSWGMGYSIYETGLTGLNNYYANNLVYGNSVGIKLQNGLTPNATITSDPLLVNYQPDGSGDYHLGSGSPAVNAGTSIGAPTDDFSGGSRPVSAGYDIGPYEYGATATAWPWM